MSRTDGWPWAHLPRSSRRSPFRGSTPRQSRCCATAAAGCSWSVSKRRSATPMTEHAVHALHLVVSNTSPPVSWNPFDDLSALFHYEFMVHAFEAGTIIAIVAGAIGYFVVLRGSAFAAHALSHIGFAGATGAVVLSLNPIIGLLAFTLGAGVTIGALGNRLRERDVTIGIVLAWTLGLGVLAIYRPLLFSSVDEDLAAAKGVPVSALSIAFMAILAVAVTEAVQVVGVLLIFALIVTPAAIAVRFTCRPAIAITTGIALALAFTWLGLAIAFYSPHPVSFFITSLAFGTYVVVRFAEPLRARIQRVELSLTSPTA